MKATKFSKPGAVKAWILDHAVFGYDAQRVANEDRLDQEWRLAVKRARAKVAADWQGDPDDVLGKMLKLNQLIPPWPPGFQERFRRCHRCGLRTQYHPDYDAHYCWRCNRWIEEGCKDPNCEFCANRPAKPLPDR